MFGECGRSADLECGPCTADLDSQTHRSAYARLHRFISWIKWPRGRRVGLYANEADTHTHTERERERDIDQFVYCQHTVKTINVWELLLNLDVSVGLVRQWRQTTGQQPRLWPYILINTRNCSLARVLVATDQKNYKKYKSLILHHYIT